MKKSLLPILTTWFLCVSLSAEKVTPEYFSIVLSESAKESEKSVEELSEELAGDEFQLTNYSHELVGMLMKLASEYGTDLDGFRKEYLGVFVAALDLPKQEATIESYEKEILNRAEADGVSPKQYVKNQEEVFADKLDGYKIALDRIRKENPKESHESDLPWFFNADLKVQKSFDKPDRAKGASISFVNSESGEDYVIDTAIILTWKPRSIGGDTWVLEPLLSTDLELSDNDNKSSNSIKVRAGGFLYDSNVRSRSSILGASVPVHSLTALYEADRSFRNQNLLAEWVLYPETDWGLLSLGKAMYMGSEGISDKEAVRYENQFAYAIDIKPGLEGGRSLSEDAEEIKEEGWIFRPFIQAQFQFWPYRDLFKQRLSFTLENKLRFLSEEDYDVYNLFEASAAWKITSDFSVSISYENGRDAPNFEKVETSKINFEYKLK